MANVGRIVKESMVEELSGELAERPNFFVTAVTRLPASEADALRQKLYASQARLVMVKRRLGRRTMERLNIAGLADLLEGSVGLVLPEGEEVLLTAKLIVEFLKTHEGQLLVRGAVIDGQLLDKSRVEQIASLPPKPVLLAQIIATIESPIADVIFTLERLLGDLIWLAEQAAAQKPSEPAAACESPAVSAQPPAEPPTPSPSAPDAKPATSETPETPTTQEGTPS